MLGPTIDARAYSSDAGSVLLPFGCGVGYTAVCCSLQINAGVKIFANMFRGEIKTGYD